MNVITRIRKSRITKGLALCLAVNMISEVVWPTAAMALTSGPSQPEVQSFEPVETTDMVNMFTGDFTYNIPLMYLPGPNGGYPINLSYHGGIGMDQEASWVGLGWNINAGALVRNVRGFADDYNGDELITKVDMKENVTVGLNYGGNLEVFGGDPNIGYNVSVRYNNYKGFAIGFGMGFPLGSSDHFSMGLSLDSETGLGASVNASIEGNVDACNRYGMGLSYNNEGLGISFSKSKAVNDPLNEERATERQKLNYGIDVVLDRSEMQVSTGQSGLGFSANNQSPIIGMKTKTDNMNVNIKFGSGVGGAFANQTFGGFFNIQGFPAEIAGYDQLQKVYGFENYENATKHDILDFTREKDGVVTPMTPNLAAPNLTYDIYSVLGQGIGGNFRPFRTDVGRVHDPFIRSSVSGKSMSYDIGSAHLGFGGTITAGYSVQRPWDYKNDWADNDLYNFKEQKEIDDLSGYKYKDRERYYYRMHGDKSTYDTDELNFIGGTEPILTTTDPEIGDELDRLTVPSGIKSDRYFSTNTGVPANDLDIRIARNILIHKLKNEDISGLYGNADPVEITSHSDLAGMSDLTETSIFYYDWIYGEKWLLNGTSAPTDPNIFLGREQRDGKSIAGQNGAYKILNENGQYYVYGLPAYNTKEVQAMFSIDAQQVQIPLDEYDNPVPEGERAAYLTEIETENSEIKYKYAGTDKYLNKTTKPPYAHSYMLTSVLGADYVDVDDNGPSDADLGYWVKFDYVKYADNYKWRAPFQGANYTSSALSTFSDDKGSYMYGEKELWYVSRIETKTHVLVFDLAERNDNFEANSEFNKIVGGGIGTQSGLLIEKISLYLKDDYQNNYTNAVPLQQVHFEYDYSLCGHVKNNDEVQTGLPDCIIDNAESGKLTLRRIWVTYEGSDKGQMRPYEFSYYNDPDLAGDPFFYNEFNYDRWGNHKSQASAFEYKFLPYVNQTQSQESTDENASAWSLKNIHLPSGGDITMTYEADDYGYVQSEEATQMFPITKVNDLTDNDILYDHHDNNVADFDDPRTRRVYFKLEQPLAPGQSAEAYAKKIYRDYVEGIMIDGKGDRNLHFKNYTQLREGDDDTYDYVSGYVPIEPYNDDDVWTITYDYTNYYKYGINTSVTNGSGEYTEGFITIKQHQKAMIIDLLDIYDLEIQYQKKYHPFSLAAWEHMRLNDPLLLTAPAGIDLDNSIDSDDGAKAQVVSSLLGFIPQTVQMFTGVWSYCYRNHHAQRIEIQDGKSVIRLCSPDLKKRGGGQRVKQITMSDNWDDFTSGTEQVTGVVYDYTVEEDDHGTMRTISSGVAQYEPMMGGDEIALRYPKFYPENVPFNSDNRSYFEYPINEQYFPAPVVGYRKVAVRSLNTANQMLAAETSVPDGIGTTGITEYEFYTAKDFPVICKESEIIKSKLNLTIPIPFVGMFERKKIKAAQGYVIELNDMHGQLKSVKKFGLNADYTKNPYETSSVEYYYNSDDEYIMKYNKKYSKKVRHLINEVETIDHDNNADIPSTEVRLVGVEYDFFTDQRQVKSNTTVAGGYGNTDIVPAGTPIPIPSFWPAFTTVKRDFKSHVTNKVIFRSGIVSEVHTYDGRARVITKNEVYDEQTGRPIISSINNEFEDVIYNYAHPAHWEYDRMGGAYKNIDLKFEGKIIAYRDAGGLNEQFILETSSNVITQLVSGDELMVKYSVIDGGNETTYWFRATYLKKSDSDQGVIYVEKDNGSTTHANIVLSAGTLCDFQVIRSGRRNHVFADAGTIVSKNKPVHTLSGSATRYSQVINLSGAIAGDATWTESLKLTWMHRVLNSSAVVFKDEWENSKSDDNNNPFRTGEAGIWRPYKSYIYVGEREAGWDPNITSVLTDIRTNGEMNDAVFFNWQVQNFENYAPQWQWMSEITKYSNEAYELENIDRLNIRSAALYAYFGSLVVGVGANAGYHELGTEDFERYPTGGTVTIGSQESDDNLGFYNDEPGGIYAYTSDVQRTYRILNGTAKANGVFWIELETTEGFSTGSEVELAVRTSNFADGGKSDSFLFTGEITGTGTSNGNTLLVVQTKYKFLSQDLSLLGSSNEFLTGRVTVSKEKGAPHSTNISEVAFVSGKAHTGNQSMKFKEASFFPQGKLDLIADKTYVLSAWVSRDDIRKIDFAGIDIEVREYTTGPGYSSITNLSSIKKGKVIEGWQKIELEFTPTSNDATIAILLSSTVDATPTFAYIDDIRISPKTGGIVTYVYDSHNYRLKAVLDNNNYATFYYYDEEGNLYQVKRETARGIQTVSENRGHTKIQ